MSFASATDQLPEVRPVSVNVTGNVTGLIGYGQ